MVEGPETAALLLQMRRDLMHATRLDIKPMPGAEQIVERLSHAGVPMAIATSSLKSQLEWVSSSSVNDNA